jgi:hypothetical protein
MSASGHKRTFRNVLRMSALPPKADIDERDRHVRFVKNGDICTAQKNNPATDTDTAAFRRKAPI